MRNITENQMLRLYELVPDYFESEWMLRRFFELFAKDKEEETDKVVDRFIDFVTESESRPLDTPVIRKPADENYTAKDLCGDVVSEVLASCRVEEGNIVYNPQQDSSEMFIKNFVKRKLEQHTVNIADWVEQNYNCSWRNELGGGVPFEQVTVQIYGVPKPTL